MKNIKKFSDFKINESLYNPEIPKLFDELGALIEKIEIDIRKYQGRPGESGDDLDMKYRTFADNLQSQIREFREQYDIY